MTRQRAKGASNRQWPDDPMDETHNLIDYSQLPPDEQPGYIERRARQAKELKRLQPWLDHLHKLDHEGTE